MSNTEKLIRQARNGEMGLAPETVAKVLSDMDDTQSIFLEMALTATTKAERLEALCRLMFTYGVGSIVEGRIN